MSLLPSVLLTILALFVTAVPAGAQTPILYGAESGTTSNLFSINPATGAATVIGPIGVGVSALAVDPHTGVLYAVSAAGGSGVRNLLRIDRRTGAGTVIGNVGGLGQDGIPDMAFRPSDGRLYGWSENSDDLITINTTTGQGTNVANAGIGTSGSGLAFDANGTLWLAGDGSDGPLRNVNTTTGQTTIGSPNMTGSPRPGYPMPAMKFHPITGVLYALNKIRFPGEAGGPAHNLVTINTSTGVITNIGPTMPRGDALAWALALDSPMAVDFNADQAGDAFLYNTSSGAWRMEVTTRVPRGFTESGSTWDAGWQVFPAQLDGDAYSDLFLYDPVRGIWVQALNNAGDGTFTYTVGNWDRDWQIYPADLDGNGVTDIFVYNASTGVWVKCLVNGTGDFANYVVGQWDPGWTFTTADLDGNGRDDFFLYNQSNGVWVEAFSEPGTGTFTYPASGQWDLGWQIYPADLNGDGRSDLFVYNSAGVHVSAISRAAGDFDYPNVGQWDPGWTIAPAYLNNDAGEDLFLYNFNTGVWVEAFSNGAGDFTYAVGQWNGGWSVHTTDYNGDGRADVLVHNQGGTWVQLTNTSDGVFSQDVSGNWGPGWSVFAGR